MTRPERSDAELLEQFQQGNPSAFDELFRRYQAKLLYVVTRYTGDRHASEEVVDEVFLEIYQHSDRFRGQSKVFSYLCSIAFHKAMDIIRKQSRRREVTLLPEESDEEGTQTSAHLSPEESPRKIHDKNELEAILQKALDQLPEICRKAFILCELQEHSYEETAIILGLARGTVGAHVFEARKKLRKILPMDMLEIFYFRRFWIYPVEAGVAMNLTFEAMKVWIGIPSHILLSFYMDEEVPAAVRRRIDFLLQTSLTYQKEFQDYQKIRGVYEQLEEPPAVEESLVRLREKLRLKLAADERQSLEKETAKPAPGWPTFVLPRPALLSALALAIVASVWTFTSVIQGSWLTVTQVQGPAQIWDAKVSTWKPLVKGASIKPGMKLKTGNDALISLQLGNLMGMKIKENSELQLDRLFRSRQKGRMTLGQLSGKILVSLDPPFKASSFHLETPYGFVRAYGTLFLVEVAAETPEHLRVLVLEGIVEVEDLRKTAIYSVTPQTERVLTPAAVEEEKPLVLERQDEVEELIRLAKERQRTISVLDENLSLMLITAPERVMDYLENPRIFSLRIYPILSDRILKIRRDLAEAKQSNQPALYEKAARELENFAQNYLDPFGRFRPHIYFSLGGFYHRFLHDDTRALESFQKVAEFPDATWHGMAHLARGIIYEENLHDLDHARQEYSAVLESSPSSPEAEEAKKRLKQG